MTGMASVAAARAVQAATSGGMSGIHSQQVGLHKIAVVTWTGHSQRSSVITRLNERTLCKIFSLAMLVDKPKQLSTFARPRVRISLVEKNLMWFRRRTQGNKFSCQTSRRRHPNVFSCFKEVFSFKKLLLCAFKFFLFN